ncbi:hypothetical protein HYC85_023570 [Camellia sinensis]|uniref:AP2/ERF domain-containing protein n=1 Tax=Camellia sinensis TaxID=4442 RepID=A0A7J7GHC8_CAMSI|nr:hypothetical protein HYC85_023570 [Camellia sinensis]
MGMVTTVKSEMRPLKHHLCSMEAHPPVVVESVKRHKRESCAFVIGEQPQAQPQLGQVFPSTTTTGAYNVEETATRAYDLATIKYWGPTTFTNFPVSDYETEMEIMQNVTKEEYLASLRRRSSGFSRGVSKYRGVARLHFWMTAGTITMVDGKARIGRVFGNKYLYLGTYSTQEEAAHAYDIAVIEYRGINAVTNFNLSTYIRWLRSGLNLLASQDHPTQQMETQPINPSSTCILGNQPGFTFHFNPYTARDLGTGTGTTMTPQKFEILETKMPVSPCNKSSTSPTALGLLFRSSMFREMVEKNSSVTDYDTDKNEKKQSEAGGIDEFGGRFYNNMGSVEYGSSSSILTGFQEENTLPLYTKTGHSLWNGALKFAF